MELWLGGEVDDVIFVLEIVCELFDVDGFEVGVVEYFFCELVVLHCVEVYVFFGE